MKIKLKKNNLPKEVGSYILHRANRHCKPEIASVWKDESGIFALNYSSRTFLLEEIEDGSLWSDRIDFV